MADGEPQLSWRLLAGAYLGEISALSFLPLSDPSSFPLLIAGTGSQLLVYDVKSGSLLGSFNVFNGIRVHGITVCSPDRKVPSFPSIFVSLIAVFGERIVKLFRISIDSKLSVVLEQVGRMPGFDHWVLDVCFLKDDDVIAVGLSDNSVALCDVNLSNVLLQVKSSERCLLYSMRMWGESIEALRVASGTIFNEIIIWKISSRSLLPSTSWKSSEPFTYVQKDTQLDDIQCVDILLCRLTGHEGSVFRLAWSSDGTKLMSVSDDRSARVWNISGWRQDFGDSGMILGDNVSTNFKLFGHNARIWDCCLSDSIAITAGEDCTCRVWGVDNDELLAIKEHIGRGIWRCLYDPCSSLLITAGFDSAIKVHLLSSSLWEITSQNGLSNELKDRKERFTISVPNASQHVGLMDSKSEYIRCLHFTRENILYVATNNGYLHQVELSNPVDIKWTRIARISKSPIVCMDLMSMKSSDVDLNVEDLVVLGDGNGNATFVRVVSANSNPKLVSSSTWAAEKDRQLLGVYWCKALGCGHLFTADPRGVLKLWKISDGLLSDAETMNVTTDISLVATFTSIFGARIMCLDASIKEEILVCGDQRGNLNVFSLSGCLTNANSSKTVPKFPGLNHFKGAHGISSITSILIVTKKSDHVKIQTTGGDGCICYFNYDNNLKSLEFIGMKQLKDLSMIQSVFSSSTAKESFTEGNHAIGFTSADFIIWNLVNDIKMLQIPCGGWRRSYSYHMGTVPEYQYCFGYLKDHKIHIHRLWVPDHEHQLVPQVLHMQYHGREIHSLCFVSFELQSTIKISSCLWSATGCEDGTVRLTRYSMGNWCESKLLGEHVGGSAVRSLCFVSKIYTSRGHTCSYDIKHIFHASSEKRNNQFLLISVGAKQVLTSWLLQDDSSSLSFQWFTTHMPSKVSNTHKRIKNLMETSLENNGSSEKSTPMSEPYLAEHMKKHPKSFVLDQTENDWRYLAVTAFLVRHADTDSRLTVCFVVVACSDATLTLRALLLPSRLWFDVALLVPQTSPVLALQHVVLPIFAHSKDGDQIGNAYIIISGSTDGSITFWDLTETIEDFMQLVPQLRPELLIENQKRPQTGRGSQGGRWWRSSINQPYEKVDPLPSEKVEVSPVHVLNLVHQSGVNCLHVSKTKTTYCLLSGGDDQALHCLCFDLQSQPLGSGVISESDHHDHSTKFRVLHRHTIPSAHSSAVKGIWTDGTWAFSTGLDQRIRCWKIGPFCSLTEQAHLVISVPEPEALDAVSCGSSENVYQIVVAGRGMQMVEFRTSDE